MLILRNAADSISGPLGSAQLRTVRIGPAITLRSSRGVPIAAGFSKRTPGGDLSSASRTTEAGITEDQQLSTRPSQPR